MREIRVASAALGLTIGVLAAVPASAQAVAQWNRLTVEVLATLPGLVGANNAPIVPKLGDFGGIDSQGRVIGLLFPASLAFTNDNSTLYVTNFAFNGAASIDTPWTNEVTTYTVSKIVLPTTNPPFPTTGLFHVPRR